MATLTKTLAALGLIITAFSAPAMADTYHHIDQLALTLAKQSRQIVSESRHYRHTPEYWHLVADAREMSQLADHLHDVAHHHGDLAHLASDVAEIDAKFHHLESLFDRVERRSAYGYGHVHGETSHVKALLISIGDHIHHLQEDLESLRTPVHVQPKIAPRRMFPAAPPASGWRGYNAYPRNGYGPSRGRFGPSVYGQPSRGRGITIGGGSSRFTFRL